MSDYESDEESPNKGPSPKPRAAVPPPSASTAPPPPASMNNEVAAVSFSLKIPAFWRERVRVWFSHFESVVAPQKRGDKAMYQMVLAQMDRQDVDHITDIIENPPPTNKYNALKERLIQVYEESDDQQFQKLLSQMELGDQKPSHLLRRMQNLAGSMVSEATLRMMWINRLPQSARAVLAVSETISKKMDINELALMADKILEHSQPVSSISNLPSRANQQSSSSARSHMPENHTEQSLSDKIDMLVQEIAEIKMHQQRHSHNQRRPLQRDDWRRARSRSRSRGRYHSSRAPPRTYPGGVCYYHYKFGDKAYRCIEPCTTKKNAYHSKDQAEN